LPDSTPQRHGATIPGIELSDHVRVHNEERYVVFLNQHCAGDQIEKNEIGAACSAYGGGERRVQGFVGETWGKETTGETQA